jgi:hypothetical protein
MQVLGLQSLANTQTLSLLSSISSSCISLFSSSNPISSRDRSDSGIASNMSSSTCHGSTRHHSLPHGGPSDCTTRNNGTLHSQMNRRLLERPQCQTVFAARLIATQRNESFLVRDTTVRFNVAYSDTNKWHKCKPRGPLRLAPLNTHKSDVVDHRERKPKNCCNAAVSRLPKIWEHSAKELSKSYIRLPQP